MRTFQAKAQVPVIYLGDFNSHEGHSLDGPGVAFRATGAVDADEVAQTLVNRATTARTSTCAAP